MTYQRALITGASSGIGAAFARNLPTGTDLLLTGRNTSQLNNSAIELRTRRRQVHWYNGDLATETGRRRIIDWASMFNVDLLICNAGMGAHGHFLDVPWETHEDIIGVNIVTVMEMVHSLVPAMLERARTSGQRCGLIIVASTSAFGPSERTNVYAASKAFVLRFAQGLMQELRDQPIDILAFCPGRTATDFFNRSGEVSSKHDRSADEVALEGLTALGKRSIHVLLDHSIPSSLRYFVVSNPIVTKALRAAMIWKWPLRMMKIVS